MEKIKGMSYRRYREMWEEYLTIKGGDFEYWYEGLSPIKEHMFKQLFKRKKDGYIISC